MLEKGLRYAQQRNEELENIRFQTQLTAQGSGDETKSRLDKLLMTYNNWMYPHLELERADFARDGMVEFQKLKDKHKDLKLVAKEIDSNENFKVNFGSK